MVATAPIDSELDKVFTVSCPNCGSQDIVVEAKGSYFYFSKCNKCGHKVKGSSFEK